MRKYAAIILFSCCSMVMHAQELFVFTEPASNMPANSLSTKLTARFPSTLKAFIAKQRYTPEIMLGISKQLMVHVSSTFSDFYTPRVNWESARLYGKWRFYSSDDVHRHFRLAAFAEGSYSRSPFIYEDINLEGDNSGIQAGVIATQLINRVAVSATGSMVKVFAPRSEAPMHNDISSEALSYTVSAGYLLFPRAYTDYRQPNLNIYMELLGMRGLSEKHYMIDLAPSLQIILNSNLKINAGYRFQLNGNMYRIAERNWVIGVERTFLR